MCSVIDVRGALEYQNNALVARYAERNNVSIEHASLLFQECKKMLVLMATVSEPVSPSKRLDEMWHHFILHTHEYQDYCNAYLGSFLHHNPTDTPFICNRASLFKEAQRMFGSVEKDLWWENLEGLKLADIAACDSSCSGDNYCKGDIRQN